MSTHLIGGGWDEKAAAAVYGPFLAEAGTAPTVACLVLDEGDGPGNGPECFARFATVLRAVDPSCTPVPVLVPLGGAFDPASLDGADALLVCGGLTPAYHDALADCLDALTLRVLRGLPYAGFSAGAAVAAEHAVVGGWLSDGVPVCPDDAAEDLDELDVRPGLGLLPGAVEAHAAQWGTLSRLVEVVARGHARQGVALDENTLLTVDGGLARVSGTGRAHLVRTGNAHGEAVVRSYRAGEEFPL
ncbi:Type 1 glutamine amidotransferase-like domain-containing protein [Streptomyces macrosporus]|uniref:Cyanophycinase n=1 Tax=Streptomyces macrosporus TaxID=44032 RepID=A0ABP5WIT8_9ACTN